MEILLQRQPSADGCTIGRLAIDGVFACRTLEDVERKGPKIAHETAIPAGRYRVAITRSARFGKMLPILLDVPGFDGIRMHSGNVAADTAGCILVGQSKANDSILGSRLALAELQPKIAGALARHEEVWIQIESAEGPTATVA